MTLSRTMMVAAAALVAGALAGEGRAQAQSSAQTPPEGFSWYVLNELNGFYLDIDDPTNRPPLLTEVPEGVIEPVDLNRDGRTDWLIRWPDSTQFCGTGGCRTTLYMGVEDGFVRAFDRQALRFEIKVIDRERRVETALHHLECNEGQEECLRAWAWDPFAGRLQEAPSSDGVSRMGGTASVDLGEGPDGEANLPQWTPPTLRRMWSESRDWCPAVNETRGGYWRQATLYDIPDVNGDGLRDWVFAPEAGCATPPESGPQVWITTERGPGSHGEGGAVALAWTSPVERWIEYEVSERPATLLVVGGCENGQDCPGIPLRWNAAAGRLVE